MIGFRRWATGSYLKTGLLVLIALFLVIQLVPYGRDHTNPPVTGQAKFDSARTEQLFKDSCGACHSNLTSWPPESVVAPFSWLIQHDVDEGRGVLNLSEWNRFQPAAGEVGEAISGGEMPPRQYTLLHPAARLSASEKQDLVDGLTRTFQQDPPG
jgi:mono/diheme cytochrome c family protein